ncbi:MAG TPA: extensin family protein, partial [bacterium]
SGRPETLEAKKQRYLQSVPKDGLAISEAEYPELYAMLSRNDYLGLANALGNPRGMAYGSIGYPDDPARAYYLATSSGAPDPEHMAGDIQLFLAMKAGDVAKAQELVHQRKVVLNRAGNQATYGKPPLHLVFDERFTFPRQDELAIMLLKAGADPNIANDREESALVAVLSSTREIPKRREIVEAMLKAGADPNAASPGGRTPLKAVIGSGIDSKRDYIALLMKQGANPDKPDPSGKTLVQEVVSFTAGTGQAVFEDQAIEILGLIITPKTNLNAKTKEGKTALGIAFLGRRPKVVAFLQSKGGTDYGFKNPGYDVTKAGSVTVFGLYSQDIYALDREQCLFILDQYGVEYEVLGKTPGVEIPIQLKSPISGIAYRHVAGNKQFSIMDCRLAMLLIGWAPILKQHKIKAIIHMRAYSPGARVGGHGRVSGHDSALAIDVSNVIYENQSELTVKGDWSDHRKLDPCAEGLPQQTVKERELRKLACDTGNFDLFSVILSPHYNKDHYDHLHMELDPKQMQYMR